MFSLVASLVLSLNCAVRYGGLTFIGPQNCPISKIEYVTSTQTSGLDTAEVVSISKNIKMKMRSILKKYCN